MVHQLSQPSSPLTAIVSPDLTPGVLVGREGHAASIIAFGKCGSWEGLYGGDGSPGLRKSNSRTGGAKGRWLPKVW